MRGLSLRAFCITWEIGQRFGWYWELQVPGFGLLPGRESWIYITQSFRDMLWSLFLVVNVSQGYGPCFMQLCICIAACAKYIPVQLIGRYNWQALGKKCDLCLKILCSSWVDSLVLSEELISLE